MKKVIVALVTMLGVLACSPNDETNPPHKASHDVKDAEPVVNWPSHMGRHDFQIKIAAGTSDPETFIPISVINGQQPGPTLLMVAGVHGYEFAPILAAKELANVLDPSDMSGRIIIVRTAHISAFEARSPYVNPYDRLNLNRSFFRGYLTVRKRNALPTRSQRMLFPKRILFLMFTVVTARNGSKLS